MLITLLGAGGGAVLALRDPLAYTAAASILSPDATSATGSLDPTSRSVLEAVIRAQGLGDDAEFGARVPDVVDRLLARVGQAPGEPGEEAAYRALRDSVTVTRGAPVPLLTVAVTAGSADTAARLARAVAEAAVAAAPPAAVAEAAPSTPPVPEAQAIPPGARAGPTIAPDPAVAAPSPDAANQTLAPAGRRSAPVDAAPAGRVAALRAELQRAEGADEVLRRLDEAALREAAPATASGTGRPAAPVPATAPGRPAPDEAGRGALQDRLQAARDETARLRDRLAEITRARASRDLPSADLLGSEALAGLLDRYAGILARRDSLGAVLGPRHPAMRAVLAEAAGMRRQVARELARLQAGTARALARARAAEADLARQASTPPAPQADSRRPGASGATRDPPSPAAAPAVSASPVAATVAAGVPETALAVLRRDAEERRAAIASALDRASRALPATPAPADAASPGAAAAASDGAGRTPSSVAARAADAGPAPSGARASRPAPGLVVGAPGPAVRHGWTLPGAGLAGAAAGLALGLLLLLARDLARLRRPGAPGFARVSGLPLLASLRGGGDKAGLGALHQAVADAAPEAPPRIVLLLGAAAAGGAVAAGLARLASEAGRSVLLVDADDDQATRELAVPVDPGRRLWSAVRRTALRNLSVLVWSAPFIGTGGPDDRGGTTALRAFAAEHDVVLVHAPVGRGTVHLRPLAAAATTLVLLADRAAASRQAVEALKQSLGPQAGKLAGFAWVAP